MAQDNADKMKKDFSFLESSNLPFIEHLFEKYLEDPNSVDPSWHDYFNSINFNKEHNTEQFSKPSWAKKHWPVGRRNEQISAMDGYWPNKEKANGSILSEKKVPIDKEKVPDVQTEQRHKPQQMFQTLL